jgi:hypothetical protein
VSVTATPTDVPVTEVITAEIAKRMVRYHRLPAHYEVARAEEMAGIEALVDQLLALRG